MQVLRVKSEINSSDLCNAALKLMIYASAQLYGYVSFFKTFGQDSKLICLTFVCFPL